MSRPGPRLCPARPRSAAPTSATLLALTTVGCGGVQSALDPAGPAADAIAWTWWLMASGAALVLTLVMGLLWHVLARRQGRRPFVHGTWLIIAGGLMLPSLTLIALLIHGTAAGRKATATDEPIDLRVQVEARQWSWTFRYLDSAGRPAASTTNVLALPLGRTVEFRVTSVDVIHSFWIPRLGGKIDAIPGRVNILRLRADRSGPMRGQCAEFCGLKHAHMSFDVVTLPTARFDRWLASGGREPLPRATTGTPAAEDVGNIAGESPR